MSRDYYDMYKFTKKVHSIFLDLIDSILGTIDLPRILNLSPKELNDISEAQDRVFKDPFARSKMRESIIY